METINNSLFSFSPSVRAEKLNGREYLVAPITLIVSGVLEGSKGPLYYPENEISNNYQAWNGVPIVLRHPTVDGFPVSARNPKILESYGIGQIFNAQVIDEGKKLTAEGWFDVEQTKRIGPKVYEAIKQGQKVEVSTGLFTDNHPAPQGSTFNNKQYQYIARNYRPDHLAILPDEVGACGIRDGCGVNNKSKTNEENMDKKPLIDFIVANCSCWKEEDRETLNAFSEVKLSEMKKAIEKHKEYEAVVNAAKEGFGFATNAAMTVDDMKKKMMEMKKADAKEEEKEGEKPVENKSKTITKVTENKTMTFDDWMKSAPNEVQEAVKESMAIQNREKEKIVTALCANVQGDDAKKNAVAFFSAKPLAELRTIHSLLPIQQQSTTPVFVGDPGLGQVQNQGYDETDILALPTINWAE